MFDRVLNKPLTFLSYCKLGEKMLDVNIFCYIVARNKQLKL